MDKLIWVQLHLWFEVEEHDFEGNVSNRYILKSFLEKVEGNYTRFFYLYENSPTIFLAIETSVPDKIYEIYKKYEFSKKVKKHALYIGSDDRSNGEAFLNTMCAFCLYTLDGKWDSRVVGRPQKDFKRINHLIHCMLDAFYGSREDERNLYKYQLKYYKYYKPIRRK